MIDQRTVAAGLDVVPTATPLANSVTWAYGSGVLVPATSTVP